MRRHELSDQEWGLIEDLFPVPQQPQRGRPPRDHRHVLNGLFWILSTGAAWRDLPERYGPWQTVYDRFATWRLDGTFDRIIERLQVKLDEQGLIDFDTWCVDATSVRATRAAAGAVKKGGRVLTRRNRKIMR